MAGADGGEVCAHVARGLRGLHGRGEGGAVEKFLFLGGGLGLGEVATADGAPPEGLGGELGPALHGRAGAGDDVADGFRDVVAEAAGLVGEIVLRGFGRAKAFVRIDGGAEAFVGVAVRRAEAFVGVAVEVHRVIWRPSWVR